MSDSVFWLMTFISRVEMLHVELIRGQVKYKQGCKDKNE